MNFRVSKNIDCDFPCVGEGRRTYRDKLFNRIMLEVFEGSEAERRGRLAFLARKLFAKKMSGASDLFFFSHND